MLGGCPVIAVVPARGGSQGIPRKNLALLGSRSLLSRAIAVAKAVPAIDRIIVSTDDKEIGQAAIAEGVEVHWRPAELATASSKVVDALRHLADHMLPPEAESDPVLALLEPTCPFRAPQDVSACLEVLEQEGCDSVATFTGAAVNPWRTWSIQDHRPTPFIPGADPWRPRQQLPPAYQLSGAAYVFRRSVLRDPGREILSGDMRAVVVPNDRSIDIDTPLDLRIAEAVLESL